MDSWALCVAYALAAYYYTGWQLWAVTLFDRRLIDFPSVGAMELRSFYTVMSVATSGKPARRKPFDWLALDRMGRPRG